MVHRQQHTHPTASQPQARSSEDDQNKVQQPGFDAGFMQQRTRFKSRRRVLCRFPPTLEAANPSGDIFPSKVHWSLISALVIRASPPA